MSGAFTPDLEEAARAKQAVRERVWALLERERVARFRAPRAASQLRGRAGGRRPAGLAASVAGGPRAQGQP